MSNSDQPFPHQEKGFSLLEVVVAIFILTIALLGAAAAITRALEYSTTGRSLSNAKLIIVSTIEEIEALRNSKRLEFKQLANVSDVDNTDVTINFGGFSTGMKAVSIDPGQDTINGTDDDLLDPGPDNTYGTTDDFENPARIRSGYQRQIIITPLSGNPTIKRVEVKIKYFSSSGTASEVSGASYINDEARRTG